MTQMDLWGDILESDQNTEEALNLLKEQASILKEKTKGKVDAVFSEIRYTYKPSSPESALSTISQMSSILKSVSVSENGRLVEIDEHANLKNANSLYSQKSYKFELISEKYKFRLFTIDFSPNFPIYIEPEYGIIEKQHGKIKLKSVDDLTHCLTDIFNSKKVKYIVYRMFKEK